MIRYIFTALAAILCGTAVSSAQSVKGYVGSQNEPLQGATVYWAGTNIGTTTDENGRFTINGVKGYDLLVASYLGYVADTITYSSGEPQFILTDSNSIEGITVNANQRGNYVGITGIAKNELISFSGLCKMACCNLAESFENSAAVTVGYSDAISGARQIRMLGLTGIYSQLLDESRPVMRGLGTPYGLNYTPGMWLQSIQVSKGTSSVVNGHESISGQINLEYRKPTDEEPLFINGYFDQQLRSELNVASSIKVSDRFSTVILAHGSLDERKEDHNGDNFLDNPLTRQINFANRWLYSAPSGAQLRAGVKYVTERRRGGEKDFKSRDYTASDFKIASDWSVYTDRDASSRPLYGSQIDNENFNAYFKAGFPVGRSIYNDETEEEIRSNIAIVADYNHYSQKSFFGMKDYNGIQNSFYANLLYNLNIDKRHTFVMGASATVDNFNENLTDAFLPIPTNNPGSGTMLTRQYDLGVREREVGAFAEYNLNLGTKFNFIAGLRADHHNLYDWIITPRAHLRWALTDNLVLRGSAGKGSRSARLITDNIGVLTTGRRIVFDENLDRLEESTAYGASLTYIFRLGADDGASLSFDYFHTRFSNQVVADQEYSPYDVYFYNLPGTPTTNTLQGDFNWSPFTGFDIFATYRHTFTDMTLNRASGDRISVSKPLVDKFKTLINLQYATRYRKWVFDFTAQLNGQSRLPNLDADFTNKEYSSVYPMFFGQVSRKFRKVDIYVGCENIGNYRQKAPVISADKPFDTSFNSSVVWGPLMGRKIYGGFRFSL